MRKSLRFAAVGLLLLISVIARAEDKNLLTLAHDLGAVLEWDPLRDAGVLVVGDDRVALEVGADSAIINYRLKVAIEPPARRNGVVWLSTAAVKALGDALQQDREAHAGEHMRVGAIVLDPGHGGEDTGAIGSYRDGTKQVALREKDVTLSVALKLGAMLAAAFPDKKIVYTRTTDTTVKLDARPQLANSVQEKSGDMVLYVSIHANSSPLKVTKTSGFEVWYLPPAYQRSLLDKTNVQPDDLDILPILNLMRQEEVTIETLALASLVSAGLQASIGDRTTNRGLLQEEWNVVRNARMPAVLVEVGFVNNLDEGKRLADPAYLNDVAQGIYTGIKASIARFEQRQE
jgi:N-acetylmuramoyl-L-alanine amidase